MSKNFLILTFALLISLPQISFGANVSGYSFPENRIKVITNTMPLRPPRPNWSSGNFSNITNYYRRLNASLVRRNPIVDARRTVAAGGNIERLVVLDGFSSSAKLSNRLGNPFQSLNTSNIPKKLIQGSGFEGLSNGLGYNNPENKVLEIYAQSAVRYAYYFNRTIAQHIKEKNKKTKRRNHVNCE